MEEQDEISEVKPNAPVFSGIIIVIPSLNPDDKLLKTIKSLNNAGFDDVILINDGSEESNRKPFEEAETSFPYCTILTHEANRGKGAALKTAFDYIIKNRPCPMGVVTVDGDGQHMASDAVALAQKLLYYTNISKSDNENPSKSFTFGEKYRRALPLIIGVRDFSVRGVPKRSQIGNFITSKLFKILFGLKITDTQTGLRAIPAEYLPTFIKILGERYEYETNMLLESNKLHIPIDEVRISTLYIDDNSASHFQPVRDSFRIYRKIFKFMFSSLSAALIDYTAFNIALNVFDFIGFIADRNMLIMAATVFARILSSFYNYSFNFKMVFSCKKSRLFTIIRYYALCIPQMFLSGFFVSAISGLFGENNLAVGIVKIFVDILLFFISFRIQRGWVFLKD